MLGQKHTGIQQLGLLRLLPRVGARSPFELTGPVSAIFRAVGVAVAISVSLSPVSAEVEETSRQDGSASGYSDSAFANDLMIDFSVDNFDSVGGRVSMPDLIYDMPSDDVSLRQSMTKGNKSGRITSQITNSLDNFGRGFIPETVWSLDVSTGGHVSGGELGSELDMEFGSYRKTTNWWTNEIVGPLTEMDADTTTESFLRSPPQFQVASCGKNSSERNDLEHCGHSYNLVGKDANDTDTSDSNKNVESTVLPNNGSTLTGSPNQAFPYAQDNRSDVVNDLSIPVLNGVDNFVLQDAQTNGSALLDACDGILLICEAILINPLIRGPLAGSDGESSAGIGESIDGIGETIGGAGESIDGTGETIGGAGESIGLSDPPSIFVPRPAVSSVPETSTWMMIMIGFGILAIGYRGRSRTPIERGVVETFAKKSVQRYMT